MPFRPQTDNDVESVYVLQAPKPVFRPLAFLYFLSVYSLFPLSLAYHWPLCRMWGFTDSVRAHFFGPDFAVIAALWLAPAVFVASFVLAGMGLLYPSVWDEVRPPSAGRDGIRRAIRPFRGFTYGGL